MDQLIVLLIVIIPFIASGLCYFMGKINEKTRNYFLIFMMFLEMYLVYALYPYVSEGVVLVSFKNLLGMGLYFKVNMFRYLFIFLTVFIWLMVSLYSLKYIIKYKNRCRYYMFFMLTLGATVGVFLSNNVLNLFTFFELMTFTSYPLIIHDEDSYSYEAGKTYLALAILGGLVLLLGIILLYDYTKALNFTQIAMILPTLGGEKYIISGLMLIGFAVKASVFPLHIWLPKAHPAAPSPASAVLSGILIKTGLYGILVVNMIFMQNDYYLSLIILGFGLINMFFGSFFATLQRNIKRILAFSSMSQSGYILTGIGIIGIISHEIPVVIVATILYIINHGIFKVLLFLATGIIYMNYHDVSLNELKGYGKRKTLLKLGFLIGGFSLIGFPGSAGYLSKTLLHSSILQLNNMYSNALFYTAEIIFVFSSAMTIVYFFKIFIRVFVEYNEKFDEEQSNFKNKFIYIPIAILAFIVMSIGMDPNQLIDLAIKSTESLGYSINHHIHFYSYAHIGQFINILLIGILFYFLVVRIYLLKDNDKFINPSNNWLSIEEKIYVPFVKKNYYFLRDYFLKLDRLIVNYVMLMVILVNTFLIFIKNYRTKKHSLNIIQIMSSLTFEVFIILSSLLFFTFVYYM